MKPVIGITSCIDRGVRFRAGADYLYVRRAYAERVRDAGAIPVLLGIDTPPDAAARLCDAFVVTGGDDLPESLDVELCSRALVKVDEPVGAAGAAPRDRVGAAARAAPTATAPTAEDPARVEWDCQLLREVEGLGKPVLGVCYGMQLLNLFHGGGVCQSLRLAVPGALDHGGGPSTTGHPLEVLDDSALLAGLGFSFDVNSCHRQAVSRVAPGFRVTGRAPDGVVEAIERGPWFGVQWHPETDGPSARVYDNFVALLRRL